MIVFKKLSIDDIMNIAIIILCAASLVGIIMLIFSYVRMTPTSLSDPIVKNAIRMDNVIRDGQLRYYNGNTFAEISPSSLRVQKIVNFDMLLGISSITWLKSGAIITFGNLPSNPSIRQDMDAALNKVRRDNPEINIVESNAYWYLDFKSSKISLLTYSEETNPLHYDKNTGKIFFYDLPIPNATVFGTIDQNGDVRRAIYTTDSNQEKVISENNELLYFLSSFEGSKLTLKSYNKKTKAVTELVRDVFDSDTDLAYAQVSINNGKLFYVDSDGQHNYIKAIDINSKNRSIVLKESYASHFYFDSGSVVNVIENGKTSAMIYKYDIMLQKEVAPRRFVASNAVLGENIIYNNDVLYIKDGPNIYDILSAKKRDFSTEQFEKTFRSNSSYLDRDIFNSDMIDNSYSLFMAKGSLKDEYQKVKKHLESKGQSILDFTIQPRLGSQAVFDL